MQLRELTDINEIDKLAVCLEELAAYHNKVSVNFKGCYPAKPVSSTLADFASDVERSVSRIAIVEQNNVICGFAKVDIDGDHGKLAYLVVLEKYRGLGYGGVLMEWAMNILRGAKLGCIEVKMVAGSPAIHLYEKYGFKLNAYILRL